MFNLIFFCSVGSFVELHTDIYRFITVIPAPVLWIISGVAAYIRGREACLGMRTPAWVNASYNLLRNSGKNVTALCSFFHFIELAIGDPELTRPAVYTVQRRRNIACQVDCVPMLWHNVSWKLQTLYFYVHTVHFDKLIFIITPTNAHIISIKLYYNCCNMFQCPRTIFMELNIFIHIINPCLLSTDYLYLYFHTVHFDKLIFIMVRGYRNTLDQL
jgi:hypothetical protein